MNIDIRKREVSYRNLPIILSRHRLWLEDSSKGEKADFSNTHLVGAYFRAEDLRGVNFQGAYLKYADLRDAKLFGADFSDSDLREANFQGADLFRANLTSSNIHKAIVDKNALNDAIM
jgi:uncharacterized protein YjbI with pentapeptide repeats